MTETMMDFQALVEENPDADVLRDMISFEVPVRAVFLEDPLRRVPIISGASLPNWMRPKTTSSPI